MAAVVAGCSECELALFGAARVGWANPSFDESANISFEAMAIEGFSSNAFTIHVFVQCAVHYNAEPSNCDLRIL